MSATAVRSEYAALLSSALPAVIRSEAENERCIRLLEELDRKGSRMSAAERRMAELLTLLIEDFEEKHYALKAASPRRCAERTHAGERSEAERPARYFRHTQHRLRGSPRQTPAHHRAHPPAQPPLSRFSRSFYLIKAGRARAPAPHTYPYSSPSSSYARRRCGITMVPPTTSATLIASSCSARVTPSR